MFASAAVTLLAPFLTHGYESEWAGLSGGTRGCGLGGRQRPIGNRPRTPCGHGNIVKRPWLRIHLAEYSAACYARQVSGRKATHLDRSHQLYMTRGA